MSGYTDMRDLSGTIEVEPTSSRLNAPELTMDTLKKYYNQRCNFFQEFYSKVKSYNKYNFEKEYQAFLKRKLEEDK